MLRAKPRARRRLRIQNSFVKARVHPFCFPDTLAFYSERPWMTRKLFVACLRHNSPLPVKREGGLSDFRSYSGSGKQKLFLSPFFAKLPRKQQESPYQGDSSHTAKHGFITKLIYKKAARNGRERISQALTNLDSGNGNPQPENFPAFLPCTPEWRGVPAPCPSALHTLAASIHPKEAARPIKNMPKAANTIAGNYDKVKPLFIKQFPSERL